MARPAARPDPAASACPACGKASVAVGPRSRLTGRRIGRCSECGVHFWANPHDTGLKAPYVPPADQATTDGYSSWVELKREQVGVEAYREMAAWLRSSVDVTDDRRPRLYDVGAGDGQFLKIARDEFGFDVTGNEIMAGAVTLAKERYDVVLELGDLSAFGHHEDVDAVTMWCVLAHVDDGDDLLRHVHAMLRPGGVLALQTPHWTAADAAAHSLQRATNGRVTKLTDRRIARHHRVLHTARSIRAQLERHGFTDVAVSPQQRYSLTSQAYLASLNPPAWTLRPASWLLDKAVAGRLAPRIVLDVRARRR